MSPTPRLDRVHRLHAARYLCLLALVVAPARARSQPASGVALGARLRVEMPTVERLRPGHERQQFVAGTLTAVRGDTLSLVVGPGAASLRVPRESIRRLYVSRGRPPRWQAALRGAIAPALLGAAASAVGMAIHRKDDGPSVGSVIASSAAWGAASGAAFGAWSQRERWRRVPLAASWPSATATDAGIAPPPNEK